MKHTVQLTAALLAMLMLASCSNRKGPAEDTSDIPSTQPPAQTTAPETVIPVQPAVPPEEDGFEFVENAGNLKLSELKLDAELYHTHELSGDRLLFVLCDRLHDKDGNSISENGLPVLMNIRAAIYDKTTGQMGKAIPLGGGIRPTNISYEEDGVILYTVEYDANGVVSYPAWKLDPDAKSPALTPVKFDGARAKDMPVTSPDGKWSAYRQNLDLSGDHEIVLSDAKGQTRVILEARMLDEAGAGLWDVEGYHLVGFLDNEHLIYYIGGWEWVKGYGIYSVSTGKKTEFRDGLPVRNIRNGKIYATDGNNEALGDFYEVHLDGTKTLLAAADSPLFPKAKYYQSYYMNGEYWILTPYTDDGKGLGDTCVYDLSLTKCLAKLRTGSHTSFRLIAAGDTIVVVTNE